MGVSLLVEEAVMTVFALTVSIVVEVVVVIMDSVRVGEEEGFRVVVVLVVLVVEVLLLVEVACVCELSEIVWVGVNVVSLC